MSLGKPRLSLVLMGCLIQFNEKYIYFLFILFISKYCDEIAWIIIHNYYFIRNYSAFLKWLFNMRWQYGMALERYCSVLAKLTEKYQNLCPSLFPLCINVFINFVIKFHFLRYLNIFSVSNRKFLTSSLPLQFREEITNAITNVYVVWIRFKTGNPERWLIN